MVNWTASVARIRTTHDGSGRAYGIVTGMGVNPTAALDALQREAETLAQHAGEQAAEAAEARARQEAKAQQKAAAKKPPPPRAPEMGRPWARPSETGPGTPRRIPARDYSRPQPAEPAPAKPQDDGPRHYVFEVVDVCLTPAKMEGGGRGWLAYGTLAWEGYPRQAGTSGAGSGSPGGSRDDRGGSRDDRGGRGGRETR
jgi:hypothetical protein